MPNRGPCTFCNEDRVLNDRGLCTGCRHAMPCVNHADLLTDKRCRTCRKPKCAFCLKGEVCDSCLAGEQAVRDNAREARGQAQDDATPASAEEKANRRKLIALAAVLLATVAGNIWYFSPEPLTPTQLSRLQVKTLRTAIVHYAQKHGDAPPKSLVEVALSAKADGIKVPVVVPEGARPIPNVVMYRFDGRHYILSGTNERGELVKIKGKPYTVKAP